MSCKVTPTGWFTRRAVYDAELESDGKKHVFTVTPKWMLCGTANVYFIHDGQNYVGKIRRGSTWIPSRTKYDVYLDQDLQDQTPDALATLMSLVCIRLREL